MRWWCCVLSEKMSECRISQLHAENQNFSIYALLNHASSTFQSFSTVMIEGPKKCLMTLVSKWVTRTDLSIAA